LEWKTEEGISSGYREKGFFPEAVVNFFALLGWNDGTEKKYTLEELVEAFDLNRVHKAGAKFDPEKKMVQSPTFNQTKDEDLAKPSLLSLLQKNLPVK
jgi:glutamyl-tRNA synthetase